MKKLVLFAVVIGFSALGEARDSLDGCGLGWEVTDSETMVATTTRGTTNAFVPPSFGMTTGTIGCKKIGLASNDREAVNYVVNNFANLKQELAMGQGEYVEGLHEVMGCDTGAIRKEYKSVVSPATDGVELYKNIKGFCS